MTHRRWYGAFVVVLGMAWLVEPATASRHIRHGPPPKARAPSLDQRVLSAEVLLARAGFSPGLIDARDGDNFAKALHAFQQVNGLPIGILDDATAQRLGQASPEPVLTTYAIQPQDVAGPFTPAIPKDFTEMAQLPALSYRSPQQLLAAKFHMSEELLAALNRGANLAEGATITVANVSPVPEDPAAGAREAAQASGSSTPPNRAQPLIARVVVDKPNRAVLAYGADNRLLAFFPASIGSAEKPAPSGEFQISSIIYDPTYTYDPAYRFREQKATRKVTIRPGPNNPVGVVWIGLSAKG